MVIVNDNMRNGKSYNGNTLKFGITVENIDYIVKLPKEALSVYTEYLASKFIRIVEMYCPKNIWIYWGILIFILDEQYRTELG